MLSRATASHICRRQRRRLQRTEERPRAQRGVNPGHLAYIVRRTAPPLRGTDRESGAQKGNGRVGQKQSTTIVVAVRSMRRGGNTYMSSTVLQRQYYKSTGLEPHGVIGLDTTLIVQ